MNDTDEILLDIYNTLVQIRYPEITRAEPKTLEFTILMGENRISLLSWLLTEKASCIATVIERLNGAALEDELLKYYSDIGICNKKDLLLGNCTLKEQLPTLKLLLEFMRNVHIESSDPILDSKESVEDILQVYINDDSNIISLFSNIKPKLNYSAAVQYFEDIKKDIIKLNETNNDCKADNNEENLEEHCMEDNKECNKDDENETFSIQKKNFIETFSEVGSWPKTSANVESPSYSMDTDIKNIYADFSTLKQILEVKREISKTVIPKELSRINTPLDSVIEDAVTSIEEFRNIDDY